MTVTVLGEASYYSKNYHKTRKGKYKTKQERGVSRLVYVPVDVEIFLNLRHGDVIEFVVNSNGEVSIRNKR
jgi:hypothetical protein